MEMLCASPCVTTLLCFSLEKRYRMDRAWDENAWMNRHRLAARGNATTFPLAWENLVEQLQDLEGEKAVSLLPRTGQELAEVVRVLLKSNAAEDKAESIKDILHQATVRRDVVLRLIDAAVRRRHPAYRQVSMEQVALKAQDLPEHGVPPEVVAILPHDTDLDNLQPQKVATPVPECVTPAQAASELGAWLKPNAVVCEKSSVGSGDLNAQQVATLKATAPGQGQEEGKAMGSLTLTTGNRLFDQFKPEYFGMAFPHVFKFCSAMPDPPHWSPNPRHRRAKDAPRLELNRWVRAMARRCEAQVGRDWVFGFTSWNLLFRSSLNLSRAPVRYTEPIFDERTETWRNLTAKDIEAGAVQLLAALHGTYVACERRYQQAPVCAKLAAGRPKIVAKYAYGWGNPAWNTRSQATDALWNWSPAHYVWGSVVCHIFPRRSTPAPLRPNVTDPSDRSGATCPSMGRVDVRRSGISAPGGRSDDGCPYRKYATPASNMGTAPCNARPGSSGICGRVPDACAARLNAFVWFATLWGLPAV